MSKYTNLERRERDYYATPKEPVVPLREAMGDEQFRYWEPCCADGQLISHIAELFSKSSCVKKTDLVTPIGEVQDVFTITREQADDFEIKYFITNPPWLNTPRSGYQLFRLIKHLSSIRPTILLLNANLCWNKGSWKNKLAPMPFCNWVKPTSRIKWIPDSPYAGKEDCAWMQFDQSTPMMNMHPPMLLPRM